MKKLIIFALCIIFLTGCSQNIKINEELSSCLQEAFLKKDSIYFGDYVALCDKYIVASCYNINQALKEEKISGKIEISNYNDETVIVFIANDKVIDAVSLSGEVTSILSEFEYDVNQSIYPVDREISINRNES